MEIRDCAKQNREFMMLLHGYENREEYVSRSKQQGRAIVASLGFGAAEELIMASGMTGAVIYADPDSCLEAADKYLEYSFTPKARAWFDKLAGGETGCRPDYIAISDSEDVVNRINYYLRELSRSQPESNIPEIYFIDWLFSQHMMYQQWNLAALGRFREKLEQWSGKKITDDAISAAIKKCNLRREALMKIRALRRADKPRISGSEALVRALAARYIGMEDFLHCPPWNAQWFLKEAKHNNIDGVVYMAPENCMQAVEGSFFVKKTLEDAGIPVLIFRADPVDARKWNRDTMTRLVEEFIEERIIGGKENG